MDIQALLLIAHLIGTVLGVGGATFLEFNLSHALQDGKMETTERGFMGISFVILRVGLVIALLTGFGFVIYYSVNEMGYRLYNPVLWAKLIMIIVLAANALLLQAHKVSLYWGSALSFVSWWSVFIMGILLTQGYSYSFWIVMPAYIVSIAGGAYVLDKLRKRHAAAFAASQPPQPPARPTEPPLSPPPIASTPHPPSFPDRSSS